MSDDNNQKNRGPRKGGGGGKGGGGRDGGPRDGRPGARGPGRPPMRTRDGDERPRRDGPPRFRPDGERGPARERFGERPAGPGRFPRKDGDRPRQDRDEGGRPARAGRSEGGYGGERSGYGQRENRGDRFDRPRAPAGRSANPTRTRPDRAHRNAAEIADTVNLAPAAPQEPERIAKVMARAGVASRRDSEAMIAEGRVSVNGMVIDSPALDVGPADVVLVDGEALPARERTRLWLYHKPRGLVTTNHDPEGRPTVFDALPEDLPRVLSIGRLDINTEGLLLLTNDGGLARMLELPETGWLRRYRVRAFGQVTQDRLDTLRDGVTIDGVHYGPVVAQFEREQGANTWLTVDLREGKNREVKTILEHLGLQVNRLIRISFGPFQLGDIPEGEAEEIRSRVLRDQLGAELMARAGTDFESPRRDEAPAPAPARSAAPAARGRAAPGAEDRPRRRRAEPEPVKDLRGDKPWNRGVWRDEDSETPRTRRTPPRRGADPKEERQARAEDGSLVRVRDKAIADPKGRRVKVERVSSRDAAPAREEAGRDRGGEAPWQASGDWAERPQRTRHKSGEERGEHRPARESFGVERTPGRGGFGKSSFGKPSFGKTGGGKSSFGKPAFGKPGGRGFGDKPAGGRSGFSKPGFGKGPRSEGPRGDGPRGGGPGRSGGGGRPSRPGGGKRD